MSTILDRVVVMPRPSFCGRSCLLCTFTAADAATTTVTAAAAECSSNNRNKVRTMWPCQEKMDTGGGSCGCGSGDCGWSADARSVRIRTITESYHWYHSPLSIERSRERKYLYYIYCTQYINLYV